MSNRSFSQDIYAVGAAYIAFKISGLWRTLSTLSMSDSGSLLFDSDSFSSSELEIDVEETTTRSKFIVLTVHDIARRLDGLTRRVMDFTMYNRGVSQILLNAYSWDFSTLTHKYLEDVDEVAHKVGLNTPKDMQLLAAASKPEETAQDGDWECPICAEYAQNSHRTALKCGHYVCSSCFDTHIQYKIFNDGNLFNTRCPGNSDCPLIIPQELIPAKLRGKFDLLAASKFAICRPGQYRHCPHPDCEYFACLTGEESDGNTLNEVVVCHCGRSFCFDCGLTVDHLALPCELAKRWLEIAGDEELNYTWISQNSKNCPKCNTHTERSAGCNHIVCTICHYEYCWICLGDWEMHNSHSPYECVRFRPEKSSSASVSSKTGNRVTNTTRDVKKANKTKKDRERLVFYGAQFADHRNLAKSATSPSIKRGHNLLCWAFALLYFLQTNNIKVLLEGLVIALAADLEDQSPRVEQRTASLYDFIMQTDWLVSNMETTK